MKIILAAGIFPPDIGGPAIYTEELAKRLKERSIEVIVITYSDRKCSCLENSIFTPPPCPPPKGREDSYFPLIPPPQRGGGQGSGGCSKLHLKIQNYDFPVIRISRKYPLGLRHFFYFYQLLKLARDVQIIYAQNLFSAGLPGLLVAKILGKKIAVKIVGDWVWERFASPNETLDDFQNKKHSCKIGFLRRLQTYLARRANKIITPSHYLKKVVSSWGVEPEKIEVVYNATPDLPEPNFSKEEAKKRLILTGDVLLSIGRLVPWKGFSTLIETMPELLKENPEFNLVIIGEGPAEENLKRKIKDLKLEEKIKLIGKVAHQDIPLYFKAADIFVLNTNYEGFSHTLLEAMKIGTPIITTKAGGNPELIEDGENGILVDYNNKNQLKEAIVMLNQDKFLSRDSNIYPTPLPPSQKEGEFLLPINPPSPVGRGEGGWGMFAKEKLIKNSQEKVKEFNWQRLINETLGVFYSTNRELTHKRTNRGHKRRSDLR